MVSVYIRSLQHLYLLASYPGIVFTHRQIYESVWEEDIILYGMDYKNKEDVAAAVLFYEYLSEKGEAFLKQHDYLKEEVLDGLKQIVEKTGYGDFLNI